MHPLRAHKRYLAFLGHRLSGIGLVVFLPFHFLALGLALESQDQLDSLLVYTDMFVVKLAEWSLVILLSLHLLFGVRILLLEFSRWPDHLDDRGGWIIPSAIAALCVGVFFVMQVNWW